MGKFEAELTTSIFVDFTKTSARYISAINRQEQCLMKSDTGRTPVCVVVDAYSTGKYLAKELMSRGLPCVHVQSVPEIPSGYQKSFSASDFICNITHHGNLDYTLSQLCDYDVAHVIAGSELGVELTDLLSESLNLLTNGAQLTRARRDKFEMMKALRAKGIKTAEYLKAFHASEIISWAAERGFEKVVLKP